MGTQLDALKSAMLATGNEEVNVVVKAEELEIVGGGIDFEAHFFEPQPGKSYTVKFLPNISDNLNPIVHRAVYKKLPDPQRKGKTFQWVSSGIAKTDPVLELFFDLNNKKKEGDVIAEQKIKDYLSKTQQACGIVQILASPDAEQIGQIRMFIFSTFGPNATIANLINSQLNPTKDMLENGYKKENIFNIFGSPALIITCEESEYQGQKGRAYEKSTWSKNTRYPYVKYTDEAGNEVTHEFSPKDIVDGNLTPEADFAFGKMIENLLNPDYSIHNYFAYKEIGNEKNTPETDEYLKKSREKVDEIIPIIRDKSLTEIKAYGKVSEESSKNNSTTLEAKGAGNAIMGNSIPTPEELKDSALAKDKAPEKATPTTSTSSDINVDDILKKK